MGLDAFLRKFKSNPDFYRRGLERLGYQPPKIFSGAYGGLHECGSLTLPVFLDYMESIIRTCDFLTSTLNQLAEWHNKMSKSKGTPQISVQEMSSFLDIVRPLLDARCVSPSDPMNWNNPEAPIFNPFLRYCFFLLNYDSLRICRPKLYQAVLNRIWKSTVDDIGLSEEDKKIVDEKWEHWTKGCVRYYESSVKIFLTFTAFVTDSNKTMPIADSIKALKDVGTIRYLLENCTIKFLYGVLYRFWALLPNIPQESVPDGKDEGNNKEILCWGQPKAMNFTPKAHNDIGVKLGILDFEQAAKISGARSVIMKGNAALLERALANFMIDNAIEYGYQLISPPFLNLRGAFFGVGQLEKFYDDLYLINGDTTVGDTEPFNLVDDDFQRYYREYTQGLITTAEVPLTNMVADKLVDGSTLPLRYAAYTPCFRREAGSAGRDTTGMIRMHQFSKVELVSIVDANSSGEEHERLTGVAETVLRKLDLPYRKILLCTGDMGFASSKTYDLEVWLPSQNCYREISSCSNCQDFQAIRMDARYKDVDKKNKYVHTLNGSALAVGRTMVAVMENYQNSDGSVTIPEALRGKYMKLDYL